ncbi:hypothetical protein [Novosphingobium cyanobacteriorum]|uniref:Uncharacterized protein n=1 Tax=Novosphingobium cyanobacteriorum TaxID=3024215 RepID=A0ABT6CL93_9SPHN|nr:hypothetical protein [Novosphingobium cyanobacteriorum]MDF8334685.1 hypothetical protein [Novosphingobium cyanobacteriorum]
MIRKTAILLAASTALLMPALAEAAPAKSAVASAPAAPAIPRQADGKPDFSGIWQVLGEADYDLEPHAGRRDAPPGPGVVEGGVIPYTAEAHERRKANFAARAKDDPRLKCWVLGVPRGVYYPAPFQIFQRAQDLTLVHQFGNQVRTIRTDGSDHPQEKHQEFWLGDSRGHWEGETLVVDVADFNEETWLDRAGNFHGPDLHVVERWTFLDANTINYRATLDEPGVYSKPWTIEVLLHRRRDKGFQLIEDYCYALEYDRFYPHKDGQ